jgi:hypothetical protein
VISRLTEVMSTTPGSGVTEQLGPKPRKPYRKPRPVEQMMIAEVAFNYCAGRWIRFYYIPARRPDGYAVAMYKLADWQPVTPRAF